MICGYSAERSSSLKRSRRFGQLVLGRVTFRGAVGAFANVPRSEQHFAMRDRFARGELHILGVVWLAACSGGLPDHGPPPTLSGPLLSFDALSAAGANASHLPPGFTTPQQTACSPDVTRGFLAELNDHGVDNSQVPSEWAPIVPGPDPAAPTVGQPEFMLAGTLRAFVRSMLDFRPAHPFGLDTTWDAKVDDPFRGLVFNRPGGDPPDVIHCEIESGLYPETALGFTPAVGDRVLLKGAWIFDCGHPAYEAELHPPTFLAFARLDGAATVSLAFVSPYRVTQLYGPPELATAFDVSTRYKDPAVAPFPESLKNQVLLAALKAIDYFELRTLLEATRFEPLTWFVCASEPKPSPTATLSYSYRFVARSGVTVSAALRGSSGCLELHAEMSPAYKPAQPLRADQPWPWAQLNAEAATQIGSPIDVRQLILDALAQKGFTGDVPALHADVAPILETFAPLAARSRADRDQPSAIIDGADDQPFPFYGRVRVFWK